MIETRTAAPATRQLDEDLAAVLGVDLLTPATPAAPPVRRRGPLVAGLGLGLVVVLAAGFAYVTLVRGGPRTLDPPIVARAAQSGVAQPASAPVPQKTVQDPTPPAAAPEEVPSARYATARPTRVNGRKTLTARAHKASPVSGGEPAPATAPPADGASDVTAPVTLSLAPPAPEIKVVTAANPAATPAADPTPQRAVRSREAIDAVRSIRQQ